MNNNDIILSVAVITYNQEKTISKTLDSILGQEHDYPYEIVVGDDCSVDGTKSIIEDYVSRYPKIIKALYNETNMGLIKNYYNVISNCSGKYIMECAGDDWWLQGKVKTQIDFMESHSDVGMCYCQAKVWNEKYKVYEKKTYGRKSNDFEDVLIANPIPALSVCMRKGLVCQYIEDVNPVDRDWVMEDYPMWLWFFTNSNVEFIDNELVVYRELVESVSHSKNFLKTLRFIRSIYEIKVFFVNEYNIALQSWDKDRALFNIFYLKLFEKYEQEVVNRLNVCYLKLRHKSCREVIIHYISFSKVVFKLYKLLLGIYHGLCIWKK